MIERSSGVYYIPDIDEAPESVQRMYAETVPLMRDLDAVLVKHNPSVNVAMSALLNFIANGIANEGDPGAALHLTVSLLVDSVKAQVAARTAMEQAGVSGA